MAAPSAIGSGSLTSAARVQSVRCRSPSILPTKLGGSVVRRQFLSPRGGGGGYNGGHSPRTPNRPGVKQAEPAAFGALSPSKSKRNHSRPAARTPSTSASTSATSNEGSWESLPCSSTRTSSASYIISLQLASGGASAAHLEHSEQLLASKDLLQDAWSFPGFAHALERQGVDLVDLEEHSGLPFSRRVALLAAVLQEREAHPSDAPLRSALPAQTLMKQLNNRLAESLDKQRATTEHHEKVAQEQLNLQMLRAEHHDQKAQLEIQRQQRVIAAEEAAAKERHMRATSREGKRQLTLDRANTCAQSRIADREAFIAEQVDRTALRLQQVRDTQMKEQRRLSARFQLVQTGVQQSQLDAQTKSQERAANFENKIQRSDSHIDNLATILEADRNRRAAKDQEFEYQAKRVARLTEYYRLVKETDLNDDVALFEMCQQSRVDNELMLQSTAAGGFLT